VLTLCLCVQNMLKHWRLPMFMHFHAMLKRSIVHASKYFTKKERSENYQAWCKYSQYIFQRGDDLAKCLGNVGGLGLPNIII